MNTTPLPSVTAAGLLILTVGAASSSFKVHVPVIVPAVAFVNALKVIVNVSVFSSKLSFVVSIVTVVVVDPAGIVNTHALLV